MRRATSWGVIAVALAMWVPSTALANGPEIVGSGARAMGRAGAFAARADDPMALLYNPAMLADAPAHQVFLSVHSIFYAGCFQRTVVDANGNELPPDQRTPLNDRANERTPPMNTPLTIPTDPGPDGMLGTADDPNAWYNQPYPDMCVNSSAWFPAPQGGFTLRLSDNLGMAIGVVGGLGIGGYSWGTVNGAGTDLPSGLVEFTAADGTPIVAPSPVRYSAGQQSAIVLWPSIGFGLRAFSWLRLGFTFMWGVALLDSISYSNGAYNSSNFDTTSRFQATDWFIPSLVLSAHLQPHPNFDFVLYSRLTDGIGGLVNTTEGTLTLTQNPYTDPGAVDSMGQNLRREVGSFPATINNAQPYYFGFAARYAHRRRARRWEQGYFAPPPGVVDDGMYSEDFDIELDFTYEYNQQGRDIVISVTPDASRDSCERLGVTPSAGGSGRCVSVNNVNAEIAATNAVPRGYADAIQIKLGSDINVVPGWFALRVGAHLDTVLWRSRYMTVDFINGTRIGIAAGATLRIERVDISFGYQHIFQLDQLVLDGNLRQSMVNEVTVAGSPNRWEGRCGPESYIYDPSQPVSSTGCYPNGWGPVQNNGLYRAGFDMITLGVTYHIPN